MMEQTPQEMVIFWWCLLSVVKVEGIKLEGLKGHHVVVVEDIIDTGNTMKVLIPMIEGYGAKSVAVSSNLVSHV